MATKSTGTKAPAKKRAPAKKTTPAAKVEKASEPVVETDGEAATIAEMQQEEKVRFYVPRDPTSGDEEYFERSINGTFIRLRAGEIRTLPLSLVEFIEERINIQRMSERAYDAYKTKNGKLLQ